MSSAQMQRAARAGAQAINAGRFAAPGVPMLLCNLADLVDELRTELAVTRVERDAAMAEVRRLKTAIKSAEADVWREAGQG